jgi:hypothetical protein
MTLPVIERPTLKRHAELVSASLNPVMLLLSRYAARGVVLLAPLKKIVQVKSLK